MNASKKRRLGAYYTPTELAQPLTDWAIRTPADRVLDPSCGAGVFLEAAALRLQQLGSRAPYRQVRGIDIDTSAVSHVRELLPLATHIRRADFLAADATRGWGPFSAVIGNPPYVTLQSLSNAARRRLRKVALFAEGHLNERSSIWAHFVLKASTLLVQGGRLAMVLPHTLLTTRYGAQVLQWLEGRFSRLEVLVPEHQYFPEIQERTLVVLADSYRGRCSAATVRHVTSIDGLSDVESQARSVERGDARTDVSLADTLHVALNATAWKPLGQLFEVRIGIVTGADRIFTLTDQERRGYRIPLREVRPLFRRRGDLHGVFSRDDWAAARDAGLRVHVLQLPAEMNPRSRYPEWWRMAVANSAHKGYHARRRSWWWRPELPREHPLAFLTPHSSESPRLYLNAAGAFCTNSHFALYGTDEPSARQIRAAAVSQYSVMFKLAAEILGRTFGGGLLKLPVAAAKALPVFSLPEKEVDRLWHLVTAGSLSSVDIEREVDGAISTCFEIPASTMSETRADLAELRRRRTGGRRA